MAGSAKAAWNDGKGTAEVDPELEKRAAEIVRAKDGKAIKNLADLQALEIKHLDGERKWIEQQRARDNSALNQKELAAINQRFDRQQQEMTRRHNGFRGKLSRVFGGHKRQQQQLSRLTAERDRVVGERTKQHVMSEALRQRALTERDVRVERDLQEARERHSQDRENLRQQREQGFELSVRQEVKRLRMGGPKMEM